VNRIDAPARIIAAWPLKIGIAILDTGFAPSKAGTARSSSL